MAENAVRQALKKIEIFVEGFLSSPNGDSYGLVEYLVADEGKLKWLGSLEDLKLFIESSLRIDGRWSSPGGNAKKFTLKSVEPDQQFGFVWYCRKQNTIVFQGDPERVEAAKSKLISIANKHVNKETTSIGQGEIIAEIEGIKLDLAIFKSQSCFGTDNQYDSLQSNIKSLQSTQKSLKNIIKTQDETINSLQQEIFVFKSKLLSLETLLFNVNPQLNASLDLDSQIQCTAKVNPQGSNNDVGKSNCEILLPTHSNNNQSTNENLPSENCMTICSSPKSYFNINANDPSPLVSDVVLVLPASNADLMPKSSLGVEVNVPVPNVSDANLPPTNEMQVPKNETPCPFILRRGWCLKGEQCDFSHRNMVNNDQARQHSNDKKGSIFCPFLRKKGYCLKASRCDFSHVEPYSYPTGNHPVTNDNLQCPQLHPFLGSHDVQNIPTLMRQLETRLQSLEYAQIPHPPYHRYSVSQPLFPPPKSMYPRPLMMTPVHPPQYLRRPRDKMNEQYPPNYLLRPRDITNKQYLPNYLPRPWLPQPWPTHLPFPRQEIYCRRLEHFEDSAIESLWLLLRPKRLPRSISALLLAVIYHTTSSGANENFELYNHIQRNVESFLSLHPDGLVFVTGDFNPVSTLFDEKRLKRLSGLTQIINVPTRHNAILDWCLTNAKKVVFDVSQLPPIGSSDHNAILIKPHKDRLDNSCNKRVCKRDLRDSSIRHFGQTITSTDWTEIFEIPDPNMKYRRFNEVVSAMMDCFFPNKPTSVRESDKPWMTSSLKSSISKRQKSLHKYGRNSQAYRFWRNRVQRDVCSVARRKYYANSVQKLKSANPSRWWKEVKSIGGLSSRKSWVHQLLSEVNPTCEDLAESYNGYLVGLTSHFKPSLECTDDQETEVPNHLLVNIGQVYSVLRRLKTTKSPGPDGIPNRILKTFAFEFAPIIMDIYNTSVLQGVFPDQLKRSIVVPIPKVSPPQTIEDDLRPISLTAQVSKVMEGFMLQSLMSKVGLKLDPKQFALPGKSITQALVYLLHLIHAALDQGHCSVRIFFADFKKGFDLVDHNVIIDELLKLQVSPAIIRWIKSFLTSREQCVKIGPSFSSWKPVNGGLPQGTRLGPLLFAILVNSLLQDWNGRIKFVDDATALEIVPRCSPSLLPILVNDVSQYASSRGMKLNSKKCKEMTISFLQYHLPLDNAIYIDGSPVQSVSFFKLLGVLLREDLSWCDHVDYVIKKANS
ncbi:RNA-directed DNA polymerase from mobile element jockey-like [Paramuricea clavata]|uniref:RNA-directed DNA polymerase from mobile element jockey-like n=1 Tax=Paramuricea clavata TaxID=317549 RepID=A0A6S7GRT8_PARCT|nr:RNA-directed DNA polymerase from mobile element jockey-like [Paramuricea clavata]